jgi:DNA-binding protein YbaB
MLPEWQAHIDELLERYREKRGQLQDLQDVIGEASATVTTEDEMITVTVGPHGRLAGLEFNPRVYRRLSPSELAAAVLAVVGEATSQVDGQVRAALAPMLPGGSNGSARPAGSAVSNGSDEAGRPADPGPDVDLARILPERPDDLDAFRERYGLRTGPGDS